jgi:hypothetical protein
MSFYLIVFQGGNAVGSAVMNVTAEHVGLVGPPDEFRPTGDWPAPF